MKLNFSSSISKRQEYAAIFWIGVLVFILSNTYFGWNTHAQSGAERVCDLIWQALGFVGGISMLIRSLIEEAHQDLVYKVEVEKEVIK